MKSLFFLLIFSLSQTAFADWSRVGEKSHPEPHHYVDLDSVKQTGPMAIMRRVWELRNFSKPDNNNVKSVKRLSEYDCMDRRHRLIQELWFTEHWAKGDNVVSPVRGDAELAWRPIELKSIDEIILDEMCPHENDG